ncbi:MAG: SEC-C domain-containing protein [Candidatus Gastranaerophilales bacterium]|nr:SEC-C domain-containing protein [Candidatus Gastranaerophilales bacterium]
MVPTIVETVETISKTMDELIDFLVADEFLSVEFENYLAKNNIQIEKEAELNDILIDYIIEGRISNGKNVLDYFISKNPECARETILSIKKSFVSVFKINKITKNSYSVTCLASGKEYTLLPLVKTTSLRGIGIYDFIKARIIQIGGNFYLLEIFEVINSCMEYNANVETVSAIIKNPDIAKLPAGFEKQILSFAVDFEECFKNDEVIVSNKDIDKLLDDFYLFHTGKIDEVNFVPCVSDLEYFEPEEFKKGFLYNTKTGFAPSDKKYDIGIFSDKSRGLFVIPFLGTLNAILEGKTVLNEKDCLMFFLTSNKIPKSLLIKKGIPLLNALNRILNANFSNIEEIIALYKEADNFSPINILYSSQIFSKVLGYKEIKEVKTIGRNDLCPCGSGKKYKKCCLINKGG